ncbi:MAG: ribonuclease H-like domain-containing protein, partial [Treponema sp.]|nr:ribonuclease H-like domain-containing protein [Treponema sp.]
MKGNLRNRLLLIREIEGRKKAGGAPAAQENAALTARAGKAPAQGFSGEAAPIADDSPGTLPGWESAGFLAARRTVTLDFPCALPPLFPRSLGIVAPDFSRYLADPAIRGEAGPESLCFFDLETTGLSSGAGTVAFLAAFGRFVPAAPAGPVPYTLRVSQYLLLDYPGEGGFLEAALKEFGAGGALEIPGGNPAALRQPPLVVTYNGKTFDSQILRTRCLMNAIAPPEYCHADLLHPARRLWKRVLPSCSQASIETAVLGLDRSGDTPGSEAPDIWFDFLKTGKTGALHGICEHNVRDIYGLARLMAALAEIAASPLEALGKYRCDAERLALRWWKVCRGETLAPAYPVCGTGTPAGGAELEKGKSLLDHAAKEGWRKAMLVRMIDAEWRLKDPAKA